MNNIETSAACTRGGTLGHLARRLIHVSMIIFPVMYYLWGEIVASYWRIRPWQLVIIILGVVVVAEMLRIATGFIAFGQRQHERNHISSLAWGAIALVIVLLLSPQTRYSIPIVAGCALGDPVLGELRGRVPTGVVAILGMLVVALLWWLCGIWMPIPWWLPLILSPVTVMAEWPNLRWCDDNAMMMLIPLAVFWVIFSAIPFAGVL